MKLNKLLLAGFLLVTMVGAFALALVVTISSDSAQQRSGFSPLQSGFSGSSGHYLFGTNSTSFKGWLMPSHVLLLSPFVASSSSLNHFVGATFNVFPYGIGQNKSLYLGLYVNGELRASQYYNLSDGNAHSAVLQNYLSNDLANFSASLEGYTVTLALRSALPVGTTITVSAFVSGPIWIQIADNPSVQSFEQISASPLPVSLQSVSASAPYTPSVQVVSDEA